MTPAGPFTWAAGRRCSCVPRTTSAAPIRAWPRAIARSAMRPTIGSVPRCRRGIWRTPGTLSGLQCHTASPGDYTPATLAANSILHTGISGNCGLCHGNNVTALTWFNNFTPKDAVLAPAHIPYLTGTDCSACHQSSNYAVGGFGPTNMSAAKHAFVPTSCDTCHEAGLSFYLGASTPPLQGRPADHTTGNRAAPKDCDRCHETPDCNST